MAETPYQVYLYIGDNPPKPPQGVSVVNITPSEVTEQAALSALLDSQLTAADLRTRVLLIVDPAYRDHAVVMYAALCGFAGRRVDFTDLTSVVDARSLHSVALELPDAGKPEELPEFVQVGATHPVSDLPSIGDVTLLSIDDTTLVRFARHARLALGNRTAKEALTLLVALAGVRVRNGGDRLPWLVAGDEPFTGNAEGGDEHAHPGIDLDAVRRGASEIRRSRRTDDRGFLVPAVSLSPRQDILLAASRVPAEVVLERLGSTIDPETGFWRCPRPERHRNGDANPSTRVNDGLVRCFRCDLEPVDVVRLVMDCEHLSPDEAADWLLAVSE